MQTDAEVPIHLAGGLIFDGTGSALFPGDVLVVGNRIDAVVADGDSWSPPDHALRVELDGRTVMPGLVEGHAHISFTGVADLMELVRMPAEENLIAGGHIQADRSRLREGIDRVYQYFPRLGDRRHVQSGYLSGGEQQMLVIGRALMSSPKVILLDEPSLGLAPMLVDEIFEIVQRMNRQEKLTVLLVEQNATLALAIADHGYVMENGRIVLEGAANTLRENADIKEFYLGLTEVGGRKSYREVKHYKRRKRWLS